MCKEEVSPNSTNYLSAFRVYTIKGGSPLHQVEYLRGYQASVA